MRTPISEPAIPRARGFTLIELMVSIAVLAVIVAMAVPSFADFRQRRIAEGAADQLVSFFANARFEAAKRNQLVKVVFLQGAGGATCLGAAPAVGATPALQAADNTTCDCFTPGACSIAQYPGGQGEWSGASWVAAPTIGANTGVAVINPKNGALTEFADAGQVTLRSPSDDYQYQLRVNLTGLGRMLICEPTDAPRKLPRYLNRRCGA